MIDLVTQLAAASFAVSTMVCVLLIFWFGRTKSISAGRNDTSAVQAAHTAPTPRLGGLAIVTAVFATCWMSYGAAIWGTYSLILLSALPVFVVGLAEDLGFFASPRNRLLAAAASGALFMFLMGQWLPKTDIPGFDVVMRWAPLAIAFSLLLAVGISHAFNLIDGLNGLTGMTAVGASLALALIAHQSGLTEHRDILLIICAAVIGFLALNFPFGQIFLGDAGAYVIGHLLVWISISILWNAPNVTPFAMLLVFFWPLADTLLAISRRLHLGKPIAQPDRLHFHQLVMRGVEIVLLGRRKRRLSNPLATMFTVPFILTPMIVGVFLAVEKGKAAVACIMFTAFFVLTYKIGMWLAPKLRRSVATTVLQAPSVSWKVSAQDSK